MRLAEPGAVRGHHTVDESLKTKRPEIRQEVLRSAPKRVAHEYGPQPVFAAPDERVAGARGELARDAPTNDGYASQLVEVDRLARDGLRLEPSAHHLERALAHRLGGIIGEHLRQQIGIEQRSIPFARTKTSDELRERELARGNVRTSAHQRSADVEQHRA